MALRSHLPFEETGRPLGRVHRWQPHPDTTHGIGPTAAGLVTSAGHADLVSTPDGDWYAVFLACRPYEEDFYNTGRDTYLLPVSWENGWPTILEKDKAIPTVNEKEGLQPKENHLTGNFGYCDRFASDTLDIRWM